ncbi:MAG: DUF922 domain-containing protein [Flavobacteriales bacterium]|nr:DUF922 domain-containing protein [Flavobacteriales bacterium]
MRLILTLFVIALTVVGSAQSDIPWDATQRLSWDDFEKRVGQGGYFKAYTYSGIRYSVDSPNGYVKIDVEAYFVADESWVYRGHMNTHLLQHEQAHFDITEIYARKMRKAMADYEVSARTFMNNGYMRDVKRLYNDIYSDMEAKQKEYDRATDHSMRRNAQREWVEWIESEIAALAEYAK